MPTPKGKVYGRITDQSGRGLSGVKVEVWDSDSPDPDDRMGATYTDSSGAYTFPYPRGGWDTRIGGTSFRPDVYITASLKNSANRWVQVSKSRVYSNLKLKLAKNIDLKLNIAPEQKLRTKFQVSTDGFKFGNSFVVNDVFGFEGPFEMGFCGGMSAGALHRFNTRCAVPTNSSVPRDGTPLFDELFQRQFETLPPDVLATIYDWQRSPDLPHAHTPNSIRFRQKAEWQKLQQALNRKVPVVLVLIREEGYFASISKNHQVLAIGYEYKPTTRDLKVEVYDPNDKGGSNFLYLCLGGGRLNAHQINSKGKNINFRGFFVNWAGAKAAAPHHHQCNASTTQPTRRTPARTVPIGARRTPIHAVHPQ